MNQHISTSKPIVYIFHGRFPDPRAAAIFAAEEVKSLAAYVPITMVVPNRDTTDLEKARALYHLPERVRLVALPVLDISHVPLVRFFSFALSLLTFSYGLARYLKQSQSEWVITTDHIPALVASLRGKKVMIEVHDFPTKWNPFWRLLLARADVVLSTNIWKKNELNRLFNIPHERIFVERNGIDLGHFVSRDKRTARHILGLPLDAAIALYTGNLYPWKGVDTLVGAAKYLPNILVYIVGGTPKDQDRMRKYAGDTVRFVPRIPHEQVTVWQSAADALILPNSAREEISAHHTSPMKLFEYMASERPIIASDLPSIREILPENAGFFCVPDDPRALADAIQRVFMNPQKTSAAVKLARDTVEHHTWDKRARRILERL